MLGVNSKREPLRGDFAKQFRELMKRVDSKALTESDWRMLSMRKAKTGHTYKLDMGQI